MRNIIGGSKKGIWHYNGLLNIIFLLHRSKIITLNLRTTLKGQTPNTVEWANRLSLETERQDGREQGLRRLLKNPLRQGEGVMEPLARQELEEAARNGQGVRLSLGQTDRGDRRAVLPPFHEGMRN
jgi:hypothetical protein